MVEIDNYNEKLEEHLKKLLDIDIYSNRRINACPHCNSKSFIKHGSYQDKQRFLCKTCRKTFCKRTNTLFYRSKKSAIVWAEFINLMLSKKSLRESSRKLNISLNTTFFWRHKILYSLVKFKEPILLINKINMIKVFTKENYKGDRNAPLSERRKVWSIVAQDTEESILASPISIDKWDKKSFDKFIYSKIDNNSFLNVFSDRYLEIIAKKHNNISSKNVRNLHETLLWRYVKDLRDSLKRFNGVATKYLSRYLYLSTVFSVGISYDATKLLYKLSTKGTYIKYNDLSSLSLTPS